VFAISKTARIKTYIGIGTNVGDRVRYIKEAISRLRQLEAFTLTRVSPFYETDPVGGVAQGPFLNGVIEGRSHTSPEALLAILQGIEKELGRIQRERWGAREIDLDLLMYGDLVIDEPGLILPHPRLHERSFVLVPLSALCETLCHPKLKKTVKELLTECPDRENHPKPYPIEVMHEAI